MLEYDRTDISEGIDIEKCKETSKECSLCKFYYFIDKNFSYSGINLFLIEYACCKLSNIWLLLFENNSRSYHDTGASHCRKNIVAVITQNRVAHR